MSNNKEFDKNSGSQYNSDLVIKESADYFGKALRTVDSRSLASQFYTHFRAQYDVNSNPTSVQYYRGSSSHTTTIYTLAAATLNNKHLSLYTAPDENKYTIWFNVDGAGVQPVVTGTYGYIEVPVQGADNATIVAMAIELKVNTSYPELFKVSRINQFNHIEISTANLGETQNSIAGISGFVIENKAGTQVLVNNVVIDYNGFDPIYNGQLLKDYNFNLYSGKFEKNQEVTLDNVSVSTYTASDPLIQNITALAANTEYAIVFPVNTFKLQIRVRDSLDKMQISWEVGESGTNYITVGRGVTYTEESLSLKDGRRVLYFQTTKPGTVLEILSWV